MRKEAENMRDPTRIRDMPISTYFAVYLNEGRGREEAQRKDGELLRRGRERAGNAVGQL